MSANFFPLLLRPSSKLLPLALILIIFLNINFLLVSSHVSLTFPPSRKFSLDFLNNFWTQPPCGMPKGTNMKTTLVAGSMVNVTWHLGYAHSGGYKLELLSSLGERLADLTPSSVENNTEFVQGKTTAQWHLVSFPSNLTCQDCIVRLLRQVPEFSPSFAFWSCSDVDIVEQSSYVETCSGGANGKYSEGTKSCSCCKRRWGPHCQYEDECSGNEDCGGVDGGKCINLGGSALPRKQCFCAEGYFGERCGMKNPPSMPTRSNPPDLTKYFKIPMGDRMATYFQRLLGSSEDEDILEFVVEINGTSWAGIGWRPLELGPICKSWPFVMDALDPNKKPTLVMVPAAAVVPTPPPSEYPETTNPPIATNSTATCEDSNSTNCTITTTTSAPPTVEPPPQFQYQFIPSEWAAQDPFTPMDCSDIVMGAAVGNFSRLRDSYARGRHTPQMDKLWGGQDDLLGAIGWEEPSGGGNSTTSKTTLIFRRQVVRNNNHGADHPLKGELLLIYARGQQPGEYVHNPALHLDVGVPIISDFYTVDEYKYHGLGESQRGFMFMDLSASRRSNASN